MVAGIADSLAGEQGLHGGFRSVIRYGARRQDDYNGFTTAYVLRALRAPPLDGAIAALRERALDFLCGCESPVLPGAFCFWPKGMAPAWIGDLPEDADDTAVIGLELARSGRISAHELRRSICKRLVPYRLGDVTPPAPPWIQRGAFLTWLRQDSRPNVVDCCVNANVVACLAWADMMHAPGFDAACALIEDGIRWAGESVVRARTLAPFYGHPIELLYALEHAVACGALPLRASLVLLRTRQWVVDAQHTPTESRPLWSSAYGHITWTSIALQSVRALVYSAAFQQCEQGMAT